MRKYVCIILLMIVVALPLHGITVKKIVDEMNSQHREIMVRAGGIRITQNITSLTNGAEVSSVQIVLKKDKRYRIETIFQFELDEEKTKNVILFDGVNIWFISPFAGITQMPKDESLLQGIFDDFAKLIPTASTVEGEERIGDEDCYVVKIAATASLPFNNIWISKKRFVPLKATGRMEKRDITLTFMDYKKIKGIWAVPYRTEIFIDGKPSSIVTVQSVETELSIDDEQFDIRKQ